MVSRSPGDGPLRMGTRQEAICVCVHVHSFPGSSTGKESAFTKMFTKNIHEKMFTKKIQKDVHKKKSYYYKGTLNNQIVKVSHSMNMQLLFPATLMLFQWTQ